MARGVNRVTIVGNLGADPDIKYTQAGAIIANISVATSSAYKDKKTDQWVETTEWHRIVFFNRLAEIAKEYLRKGSKVYIEGSLKTRKWQDKNKTDHYTTEIMGNELQMLDSKKSGTAPESDQEEQNPYTQAGGGGQPLQSSGEHYQDDIPF